MATKKKTTKTTSSSTKKKTNKKVEKEIKKAVNKMPIWLIVILVIVLGGAYFLYDSYLSSSNKTPGVRLTLSDDELSFHFLELGTDKTGDSTYIRAGNIDILIDAGAIGASAPTITNYIDQYCTDGVLEYVIVTHGHTDHISGFYGNSSSGKNFKGESISRNGIFYYYDVETIIDFSLTNNELKDGSNYQKYVDARSYAIDNGAKHFTAKDCIEQKNNAKSIYQLTSSISMTILDNKYYFDKTGDENDYSVCTLFSQAVNEGTRNYLLTGDLEENGEKYLIERNSLPKVELFKGGHHGSPTSSTDKLLDVIKPQNVAVCCCAGSNEYTENVDNQFPSQVFINRIAKWTEKIYVTSLAINDETGKTTAYTSQNGNIVARSKTDSFSIVCSNNNTYLKDSEWFNKDIYVIIEKDVPKIASQNTQGAILRKMRTWPTY